VTPSALCLGWVAGIAIEPRFRFSAVSVAGRIMTLRIAREKRDDVHGRSAAERT